jgi:GT2 family glycosyltransferase
MNRETVYIIILNWNGWHHTTACLESLKQQMLDNYIIILVDNHSLEEEQRKLLDYCKKKYAFILCYTNQELEKFTKSDKEKQLNNYSSRDRIVFIQNDDNLGFAKGNNIALRYVLKIGGKYAFLLNNDTIVEKESTKLLYDFMHANPHCKAVIPQIRFWDAPDKIWNCGGKFILGHIKRYYKGQYTNKVPMKGCKNVDFVSGCALLIDAEKTGVLSEMCFFGEEDVEFSLRLKKLKQQKFCLFDAIIYHKVSASASSVFKPVLGTVCGSYAVRLVNLKTYQSKLFWLVCYFSFIIYSVYGLRKDYKISVRQFFKFWKQVIFLVKQTKNFSMQVWHDCMNLTF